MFDTIYAIVFRYARFAVWAGGAMMLFAAFMVSADVLARRLFGLTMGGSDEISGYLFAIATSLAFPYALLTRSNVRIDAAYALLHPHVRAALDLLAITCMALFSALATWRAVLAVGETWNNGARAITPLQTPLIFPQSLWLTGWIALCLCALLVLWGVAAALLRGDLRRASELAGAMTQEEEIAAETGHITATERKEA